MTTYKHIVQVHPVENGEPNLSKVEYTHGALSLNDPSQVPMKYFTKEVAQAHADLMNSLIDTWEENPKGFWNKEHWKVKPEPWVVKELV